MKQVVIRAGNLAKSTVKIPFGTDIGIFSYHTNGAPGI